MTFKQKLHTHLLSIIKEKIHLLEQSLTDLRNSAANETKSTAGDKYETALAMLQAEQDRISRQLHELLQRRAMAETLPITTTGTISNGSLVQTEDAYFYISVAEGKISVEEKTVYTISSSSPLGQKLLGLKKDDTATINGKSYLIRSIE